MNFLHQEFTIHPVGQGLFYSGKILYKNKVRFRMVFDCGSVTANACRQEVEIYRDSDFLKEKILDLLVISHFDNDHVSQIGNLLNGNIMVKKLVMPFLTFTERLFLVLQYFSDQAYGPEDDFFLRFAIDPLTTIGENLDNDSEIFLVEPDPNGPIDSDQIIDEERSGSDNDSEKRFEFNFKGKKIIEPNESPITLYPQIRSYKVFDSERGIVSDITLNLMEFIFYRRKTAISESDLYDEIAILFYQKFGIDPTLPKQELHHAIIEKVKKITSATEIKEIFLDAKKKIKFMRGVKPEDLNTNALALLHRNLPDILKLGRNPYRNPKQWPLDMNSWVNTIHKFVASRVETPMLTHDHWAFRVRIREYPFTFPNVLLTSDGFLLNEKEIDPFLRHYKNYWNDFWLFQIPHHGSDRNSDGKLHSHLRSVHSCFINYGIGNRDSHPSSNVIHHLIATGNSSKIIPVNQIAGLRFELTF